MNNSRRYRTPAARTLMAGSALLMLAGCQFMPWSSDTVSGRVSDGVTLGDLPELVSDVPETPVAEIQVAEPVALDTVMDSYRDLLPLVDDPLTQVSIRHRLADLEFMRAEQKIADTAVDELSGAIDSYVNLLAEYPDRKGNDKIYYQLARAWELRGKTDEALDTLNTLVDTYPDSPYWVEAQFRRGDLLFTGGRYREAEQAFSQVARVSGERGGDESFLVNAHYMKGWSQFKQSDYQQALLSFIDVLDLVLPEGQPVENIDQRNRTLTEDLFRVFGLSLTYLDGADTLQALFRETGSRPYEILIYDRYSSLLVEREQYSDAIEVYEAFIEAHPDSRWAPRYYINIIQTLELAGFGTTIPERKADFVREYGLYSDYWAGADEETLGYIREQLEPVLSELADREYLLAGETSKDTEAREHYRQSAAYNEEFVATFPTHSGTPERLFLLGETYIELQDWPSAITAFERVAYDFPYGDGTPDRAAEAGYAAVLAFREYSKSWPEEPASELTGYQELQQLNRLRFVNAFPADARAPDVFYIALQREYQQKNWEEVVAMSQRLVTWQPAPDSTLVTEALLLSGHSLFELDRYGEAEQSYREALAVMPETDERRAGVMENLAASVFRQAEQLAEAGDVDGAVGEYLRVGVLVPTSALRANAEYDAASLLITAARWEEAATVLNGFRARFPDHELANTVPAKLALAYRETGQWEKAGDELNLMVAMASTPEEHRENMSIAAELYDKAGNTQKAIDAWEEYARAYPEPAGDYMEAANRLAELYQSRGDTDSRNTWLYRQMAVVDSNPEASDDRMRWLAASASAILAREALARYDAITLTLPLADSMAAKSAALEEAVNAYQKTAGYGLSSFATEAGYQIAHIYGRLGADLMDSERPAGLSELELEQYELLLEEQAYPFEDNAIDIHEQNILRARDGIFDEWVQRSYEALRQLLPGRYNKQEVTTGAVNELG